MFKKFTKFFLQYLKTSFELLLVKLG